MHRIVLLLRVRVTDVEHVQEQVGVHRFLKRRLEACDEVCGRSRTKPTVSLSSTSVPFSSFHARVFVSGVANSLSSAYVPAAVSVLNSHALAGVRVADDADREVLAVAAR